MHKGLLTLAILLMAATLTAQAGNVSVGVGVGIGGGYCGPRRYYRPWYPGYCGPAYYYAPYYAVPPPGYYYGPPRAPYANYGNNDPEDWPDEKAADRQDHGALLTARAWAALAAGRFEKAADLFTDEIDDHPSLGLPRIGYSITAARLGDLPTGVRAMREALHFDPQALNHVPRNELIDAKIDNVIDRYRSSYERSETQTDPAFMIAALEYVRGHKAKSVQMLDRALKAGDDSVSARNLRDLLDTRPPSQPARKAAPRPAPPAGYQK